MLKEFGDNYHENYKNNNIFKLVITLLTHLLHQNVRCNECKAFTIIGIRYKCYDCEDYDLCETCIERRDIVHWEWHTFREIFSINDINCDSTSISMTFQHKNYWMWSLE